MEKLKTILDLALGDGYIPPPRSSKCNVHFRMNHGISQKEYVLHKKKLLEQVGIESVFREYTDKKGFKVCYVLTKRYPEILEARKILYPNGKKSISKELIEMLDERSLAYLFQDDGGAEVLTSKYKSSIGKKYINNFVLNVCSFDLDSVENLSNWLKESLVDNKIYKRKGYLVITIPKLVSKMNFVEMIKGYLHKTMQYKVEESLNLAAVNF